MPVIAFKEYVPRAESALFVAPDAWITGRVVLEEDVSVFFHASLRGDIEPIRVGRGSNIQESSILHTSEGTPCTVGSNVTVGHNAILHGCTVSDHCIIGMGSTILDAAVIGEDCIIGANSLVTLRCVIPAGSLALGAPAKVVRKLSDQERDFIRQSAAHYIRVASEYASTLGRGAA